MINFEFTFGFMDYAVFVVIVVIYFILMIYLNTRVNSSANKNHGWNVKEKNENFFSVALSNIVKYSSWMILLGICSDVYQNGMQFLIFFFVGSTFMTIFMHFIIIPVFYESEASTLSEYLEQRFDDAKIKIFSSVTSIISHIFLISLSVYAVTLILSVVIDVNFFILALSLHTFYIVAFVTCNRRIKTNKWTNVISILMTCGLLVLILIKGAINFGGFMAFLDMNWTNGIFKMPNFNINPKQPGTFWSLILGGFFYFLATNFTSKSLKSLMKLKERDELIKYFITYQIGTSIITIICTLLGMLTYATFHNAKITNSNQLLALLMMRHFNQLPAVTGIFISIIFLSTFNGVSCELGTIRRIVNENIRKVYRIDDGGMETKDVTIIMRLTAIIVGILSICLIPLLAYSTSSLLEMTVSIPFTFIGSTLGILIIGIMIPWIGRRATFYGAVISLFMMIYYVLMAETRKLVSIPTDAHMRLRTQSNYISSYYYLPSTIVLTLINAFMLSFIFGFNKSIHINPKNFAPFMRSFISHHQIIENATSSSTLVLNDENIENSTSISCQ